MSSLIPNSRDPKGEKPERRKHPATSLASKVSQEESSNEKKALELTNWVTEKAVNGVPPLFCSAEELASEYEKDRSYSSRSARIDSLIKWETTKNFTSGFITGLGGVVTMPASIPSSFGASWLIQARMAATIAVLSGHDISSDRVRIFILLSLVGDAGKDVLKGAGIEMGRNLTRVAIEKIPGRVFIELNKKVGFRMLTKAGEKGVINGMKVVPVAGGLVGGVFDASACRVVGKQAKRIFCSEEDMGM